MHCNELALCTNAECLFCAFLTMKNSPKYCTIILSNNILKGVTSMMNLTTDILELRGIKNNMSKKGNVYYTINCEDDGGEAFQYVCKDFNVIPAGLKKGDKVQMKVTYNAYKDLSVVAVNKVD